MIAQRSEIFTIGDKTKCNERRSSFRKRIWGKVVVVGVVIEVVIGVGTGMGKSS